MESTKIQKIVIAGVMSAIAIFLGATRLGYIPWVTGISLTVMQVPVIIGAVLGGPLVGLVGRRLAGGRPGVGAAAAGPVAGDARGELGGHRIYRILYRRP